MRARCSALLGVARRRRSAASCRRARPRARRPRAALKAGDEQQAFARLRSPWPGLALLARGARADVAAAGRRPAAVRLRRDRAAARRHAAADAAHRRARCSPACRAPRAFPRALALAQLRGAPGQASVSLAAIVASVASWCRWRSWWRRSAHSLDDWLERILPADVYVRAARGGDTRVSHARRAARASRRSPGVRARRVPARAERPARSRAAARRRCWRATCRRDDPRRSAAARRRRRTPCRDGDPPPVWVSEAVADLYGFAPGARHRAAARGQRCARSPSRASGATTRASRARSSIERATLHRADRRPRRPPTPRSGSRPGVDASRQFRDALARAIPGAARARARDARRDPRRSRCASSTARSRSPTRSSSRWRSSSGSSACRRRSARSCSRAAASSACCATSA